MEQVMISKLDRIPVLLIAENEEPHRFVLKRVFRHLGSNVQLQFVDNGQQLLDYLTHSRICADAKISPWPDLILLDLHMPQLGGIEVLNIMRGSKTFRPIPTIVFSSSDSPHHISEAYASGANAYLVKVGDFKELVTNLRRMTAFWLQVSRLPSPPAAADRARQEGPTSLAIDQSLTTQR
ncbi:MAG: response regulator [Janthinobacterium lividum]